MIREAAFGVFSACLLRFGNRDSLPVSPPPDRIRRSANSLIYMPGNDFQLIGYSVSDCGACVTLHVTFEYAGRPAQLLNIEFSGVAAYHFTHTGGAIITDVEEIPLAEMIGRNWDNIAQWSRQVGGYIHWHKDQDVYLSNLDDGGYRAWQLDSAVGFEGFIIAKTMEQRMPEPEKE